MTTSPTRTRPTTTLFARPGSSLYTDAVSTYNLDAELRPIGAMTARDRQAVLGAVREAVDAGHQLIPLSTGHAATMVRGGGEDAYLVRTALDEPVDVRPGSETVTIPAGATWGAVATAAAEHGFAVPHGSSPAVGAVGFLLGGGLSFYGRRHGVAANLVTSITIAVAPGHEVTVDADHDPELFWALRGGGGGFGVVLAVELRLLPMWKVITGSVAWDARVAGDVAAAWRVWTERAPREVTTSLRLLNLPDVPTTPEPFRGRQVVMVDGAIAVPTEASLQSALTVRHHLLDPLREIATPLLDTWHLGPTTDLLGTHQDPTDPLPYATDTFTLRGMDDTAMRRWVDSAGPGSGSELVVAELRQLGGAFAERHPHGGAVSHLDGDLVAFNLGVLFTPEAPSAVREQATRVREALATHISGCTAPTFVENPASPHRSFPPDVEDHVEAVRSRVDPDSVFALDARRSR